MDRSRDSVPKLRIWGRNPSEIDLDIPIFEKPLPDPKTPFFFFFLYRSPIGPPNSSYNSIPRPQPCKTGVRQRATAPIIDFRGISTDFHGYPWISMEFYGYPWASMEI